MLALAPGIGDIDILVSTEFMEAGRCIANGFSTPDRTLLISSTSRFYVINEKMALGDGRFDEARLLDVAEKNASGRILFDMEQVAKESGAMINAVMLGAIAGCGRLPIPVEASSARSARGARLRRQTSRFPRRPCRRRRRGDRAAAHAEIKRHEKKRNDIASLEADIRDHMPRPRTTSWSRACAG